MIKISHKSKCCGCGACVLKCPKHCIKMQEDNEGFLYPTVDETLCVECHLCEKVCPVLNQSMGKKPIKVYAAKNKNEEQRLRSSSGGIFILLAEKIISQGGVVFGARFDRNWEAEHCYAETLNELEPLLRSKYMQSRIGNTFLEAEGFLHENRQVLFVGTPCQLAALRRYLNKDYDNLLAVDIVCHGVPSPGMWRKYLKETASDINNINYLNFREKQTGGYTWESYGFMLEEAGVKRTTQYYANPFLKAFNNELISRPSCFNCPTKNGKSGSDLTLADFWGIDNVAPEFNDHKGTSLLVVHTAKGAEFISSLNIEKLESSYDTICLYNKSYCMSATKKEKERSKFWHEIERKKTFTEACNKALYRSPLVRVKNKIEKLFFSALHRQNKRCL